MTPPTRWLVTPPGPKYVFPNFCTGVMRWGFGCGVSGDALVGVGDALCGDDVCRGGPEKT